ncbi:MAG: hypothetical protein RIR73_691 [Chloroflexota bacterium]
MDKIKNHLALYSLVPLGLGVTSLWFFLLLASFCFFSIATGLFSITWWFNIFIKEGGIGGNKENL